MSMEPSVPRNSKTTPLGAFRCGALTNGVNRLPGSVEPPLEAVGPYVPADEVEGAQCVHGIYCSPFNRYTLHHDDVARLPCDAGVDAPLWNFQTALRDTFRYRPPVVHRSIWSPLVARHHLSAGTSFLVASISDGTKRDEKRFRDGCSSEVQPFHGATAPSPRARKAAASFAMPVATEHASMIGASHQTSKLKSLSARY